MRYNIFMRNLVYTMKDRTKFFMENECGNIRIFAELGNKKAEWLYNPVEDSIIYDNQIAFLDHEVALLTHFMVKRLKEWIRYAEMKQELWKVYGSLAGSNPLYESPEQFIFRKIARKINDINDVYKYFTEDLVCDTWKNEMETAFPMADYQIAKNAVQDAVYSARFVQKIPDSPDSEDTSR